MTWKGTAEVEKYKSRTHTKNEANSILTTLESGDFDFSYYYWPPKLTPELCLVDDKQ